MAKLRALPPRIPRLDTRRVKQMPKRADDELLTPEHRAFRKAVLERAGYRCEWVEGGVRCTRAEPDYVMVADHVRERADGGDPFDPANGQCLCVRHNTLKGVRARVARHRG